MKPASGACFGLELGNSEVLCRHGARNIVSSPSCWCQRITLYRLQTILLPAPDLTLVTLHTEAVPMQLPAMSSLLPPGAPLVQAPESMPAWGLLSTPPPLLGISYPSSSPLHLDVTH